MSDAADDQNLKGGHAPAVKVGGMRVATKPKDKPAEDVKPDEAEEKEEFEVPAKTDKHHQQLLIGGAVTKGDKDFPEAAVKSYHDKPHPTHENRAPHAGASHQRVIQQPRKQ